MCETIELLKKHRRYVDLAHAGWTNSQIAPVSHVETVCLLDKNSSKPKDYVEIEWMLKITIRSKILSKCHPFCLDSPSVRNTKHFICDSLMTSDKEVHGYGSIQNRQIHS